MLPATATTCLIYRDDETTERVELTTQALGGWAARTAALLRDGCGLRAGDSVAVLLPPHWQTAAVLLGAWSIGVRVEYRPWSTAGLGHARNDFDALFVSRQRLGSWLESVPRARHRFVLGLDPGGAVLGEVPEGHRDYLAEVATYPGDAPDYLAVPAGDPASPDGTTYREWAGIAGGVAGKVGLRPGDRLLIDVAKHEQPVHWLLAPLSAGASVVLCANASDPHGVAEAEGVTHIL